jgi:hypothetical protein
MPVPVFAERSDYPRRHDEAGLPSADRACFRIDRIGALGHSAISLAGVDLVSFLPPRMHVRIRGRESERAEIESP